MNDTIIYAVDFDGTLSDSQYPDIGKPNRVLIEFLKSERAKGNKVILNTLRTGILLTKAVMWCNVHGLEFDAVNENLPEVIEEWGEDTRKIAAHYYIDDRNAVISCVPGRRIEDEQLRELHPSGSVPNKTRYQTGKRYVQRR